LGLVVGALDIVLRVWYDYNLIEGQEEEQLASALVCFSMLHCVEVPWCECELRE